MTTEMKPLPVAPRYLTRNAERTMSGFVVRGLVELITNARDSAYRMMERGDLTEAEAVALPIEVVYRNDGGQVKLIVRDRFEGMSEETVRARLLLYGERASDFASAGVRGINSRGAKDVGALGSVQFHTVRDGIVTACRIAAGRYSEPVSEPATARARAAFDLIEGDGTVVALTPFPETTVPRFQALARDLEHHVELRFDPPGLPRIPIVLHEEKPSGVGREIRVSPFQPEGELVLDRQIHLPEWTAYGDEPARLRLYRSESSLETAGNSITRLWRGEAGVLVEDGRTAHDLTFFRARRSDDSAAEYLFGTLSLPQIPHLLLEFEEFEKRREGDNDVVRNPLNPAQVTDPDRFGLNREHPFVQALEDRVTPLIEEVLHQIQDQITPSAQERLGADLREALARLGEKLAEKLDLAPGGAKKGKDLPLGLLAVPGGVRVEIGDSKRIGLYFRAEVRPEAESFDCAVHTESNAIRIESSTVSLERTKRDPSTYLGYVKIEGLALTQVAVVQATCEGHHAFIRASVREPLDKTISLDRDLQFSRRSYTSTPGRKKRVDLWADPTLEGETVELLVEGSGSISVSESAVTLALDEDLGVATARVLVDSASITTGRIVATLGHLKDEADVTFRKLEGSPRIEFEFVDQESFGAGRRFQWDEVNGETLVLIAAQHATLRRVLGPDSDNWPGQHDPQTKAILAELIADAFVARRLQDELPSLGVGAGNLVDPVDYENERYRTFEVCLALCHEALTPAFA